jgi:hypothetical protein
VRAVCTGLPAVWALGVGAIEGADVPCAAHTEAYKNQGGGADWPGSGSAKTRYHLRSDWPLGWPSGKGRK